MEVVAVLGKGFDFCLCPRLLVHELVAGECEDLEPSLAILLVELNHLSVVLIGETSVRGYVDDHDTLLVLADAVELHIASIDVYRSCFKQI